MNFSRRSLLIAAPAVILTPHLLMPVKAEILKPEGIKLVEYLDNKWLGGWVCVTAGQPGTWVPYGSVS